MKQFVTLALLFSFSATIFAQGIEFHKGNWSEVLASAKEEGKLVFVDAYTTWCGPCKWMAKNTFPDEAVGEYFNANFINAKIDMEKGEGVDIAKKYEVRAYPTLLFINENGELVHRGVGARDAAGFLTLGKEANDPSKQIMTMVKRYESGDRNPEFLKTFAQAANDSYMPNAKEIANAYFKTQDDLLTEENITMLFQNTASSDDAYYGFMVKNRAKFAEVLGKDKVDASLKRAIAGGMYRQSDIDFQDVAKAYGEVFSKEETAAFTAEFKMNYYSMRMKQDAYKEKFLQAAVDYIEGHEVDDWNTLNGVAWTFYESTTDKKLLKKACQWAEKSVELDSNFYNNDTVAAICYGLGKKKRARKYAEAAIAIGKEAGEDVSGTEDLLERINAM